MGTSHVLAMTRNVMIAEGAFLAVIVVLLVAIVVTGRRRKRRVAMSTVAPAIIADPSLRSGGPAAAAPASPQPSTVRPFPAPATATAAPGATATAEPRGRPSTTETTSHTTRAAAPPHEEPAPAAPPHDEAATSTPPCWGPSARLAPNPPAGTPAAWLPDPGGTPDTLRYWDGIAWTDYFAQRA